MFAVRQTTAAGAWRVAYEGDDEEEARIVYYLQRTAAPACRRTELLGPGGAVLASELSDRARPFKAAGRAPRQPSLF